METIKELVIKQEWQEHEPKINNNLITVEVLINRILFKPALINIDCEHYFIMDKNLITELRFPRVKILFKPIIGFINENTKEP